MLNVVDESAVADVVDAVKVLDAEVELEYGAMLLAEVLLGDTLLDDALLDTDALLEDVLALVVLLLAELVLRMLVDDELVPVEALIVGVVVVLLVYALILGELETVVPELMLVEFVAYELLEIVLNVAEDAGVDTEDVNFSVVDCVAVVMGLVVPVLTSDVLVELSRAL